MPRVLLDHLELPKAMLDEGVLWSEKFHSQTASSSCQFLNGKQSELQFKQHFNHMTHLPTLCNIRLMIWAQNKSGESKNSWDKVIECLTNCFSRSPRPGQFRPSRNPSNSIKSASSPSPELQNDKKGNILPRPLTPRLRSLLLEESLYSVVLLI